MQENPEAPKPLDAVCHVKSIPLPDGCAVELMAIHLWEHLYRWECEEVITEWKRVLRVGGLLVLEMPDLMKFCQNILDGTVKGGKHPDQLTMWAAYGDPRTKDPHMSHKWGWGRASLEAFLVEHGFTDIQHKATVHHPAGRKHRDMRIEARRS